MLSFLSIWAGLIDLAIMLCVLIGWLPRWPWIAVSLAGSPAGILLAIAGLVASLGDSADNPAIRGQRVQSLVAIGLCLVVPPVGYLLIQLGGWGNS